MHLYSNLSEHIEWGYKFCWSEKVVMFVDKQTGLNISSGSV